jgi:hypothetical protein
MCDHRVQNVSAFCFCGCLRFLRSDRPNIAAHGTAPHAYMDDGAPYMQNVKMVSKLTADINRQKQKQKQKRVNHRNGTTFESYFGNFLLVFAIQSLRRVKLCYTVQLYNIMYWRGSSLRREAPTAIAVFSM